MKDNQHKPKLEKIYIVQEQSVKQSSLSSAARNKVVSKTGSSYQSQNSQNYGPCLTYNPNCTCSEAELRRQRIVLENREIEERINRANNQNTEINNGQQSEELQRLRNEFVNLQANHNNLREQTNAFAQELDNARRERDQAQTNYDNLTRRNNEAQQQITNLTIERDNRSNTSQAEYNNLLQECNRLRRQIDDLNRRPSTNDYERMQLELEERTVERDGLVNRNQELENQQITELVISTAFGREQWLQEIESKVKSLKKLSILLVPDSYDYNYRKINAHTVSKIQSFINQNANLTHLNLGFGAQWDKDAIFFDFSNLTKLEFLSSPCIFNLNLENNKELEKLHLRYVQYSDQNERPNLNNLNLKENKKLKCLIIDISNVYSLDLSENKDLVYIDIKNTEINQLDLRQNEKLWRVFEVNSNTITTENHRVDGPWKIYYPQGIVHVKSAHGVRLANWVEN